MAKKTVKKSAAKKAASKPAKKSSPKAVKRPAAKAAKAAVLAKPAASAKPAPKALPRKGFNKTDLEHFRKLILEKRKEILDELESLKSTMMDVTTGQYEMENSSYSLHMEQGTDAMEREKTFLFASREGKFLGYLNDALKRIERGDYGFCTDCGTLLEKERLEAVPHAQQCVKCKMLKK